MKRFILSALLLSLLALGTTPDLAQAKHKKKHHKATHKVVYRATPAHSHGVDANAGAGVGLGPIHVGVNLGAGVHTRAFGESPVGTLADPMSMADPNDMGLNPTSVFPMGVIVHPGDCDIDCMVDQGLLSVTLDTATEIPAPSKTVAESFQVSSDTVHNDYYYQYVPPKVVTVGGFSVPVTGETQYYSLFKHRDGEPMPVHNHKGMDATRGFGVSPRSDNPPTSFGPGDYSTTVPEQ
jgi:hypothetical protein